VAYPRLRVGLVSSSRSSLPISRALGRPVSATLSLRRHWPILKRSLARIATFQLGASKLAETPLTAVQLTEEEGVGGMGESAFDVTTPLADGVCG
jgi:hypothetical protein